jgi:hypothetical protein
LPAGDAATVTLALDDTPYIPSISAPSRIESFWGKRIE